MVEEEHGLRGPGDARDDKRRRPIAVAHGQTVDRRRSGVKPRRTMTRMTTLADELAELKTRLEGKRPPEQVALMHRAVDELRAGKAAQRALKVGDRAPEFTLPNAALRLVGSRELLARGPLVVTFYRGRW
jgi:hypothetical protein